MRNHCGSVRSPNVPGHARQQPAPSPETSIQRTVPGKSAVFKRTFMKAFPRWLAALCYFATFGQQLSAQKPLTIPAKVIFESGIEYANPDAQRLQLDMARPRTGNGPLPAIVCIHGGG